MGQIVDLEIVQHVAHVAVDPVEDLDQHTLFIHVNDTSGIRD